MDPTVAMERYVSALRSQDWGGIYDQALKLPLIECGISKEKYIVLMIELSRGQETKNYRAAAWKVSPRPGAQTENRALIDVAMGEAMYFDGRPAIQHPTVVRSKGSDLIDLTDLPYLVCGMQGQNTLASWKIMARAMRRAKVSRIPAPADTYLDLQRLEKHLAGKGGPTDMYVPRRPVLPALR